MYQQFWPPMVSPLGNTFLQLFIYNLNISFYLSFDGSHNLSKSHNIHYKRDRRKTVPQILLFNFQMNQNKSQKVIIKIVKPRL